MTSARRIQLRRTKGWRKPEGAVVVARPSRWGNPFRVGDLIADPTNGWNPIPGYPMPHEVGVFERTMVDGTRYTQTVRHVVDRADAVELFRRVVEFEGWNLEALRGRDLACWCPLDEPCHADVLLALANTEGVRLGPLTDAEMPHGAVSA